ncbi:MAG: glycosyltransferase family 9 protein, partial [Acidobacteriota bacterium]|nr:glycosyltransferase family 9 protein [Acidobacteriota bacterium]
MDRLGDVLLSGPLVRAVAAAEDEVSYLTSPAGAPGAVLLPGVDRVVVDSVGWIEDPPPAVTRDRIDGLVERIAGLRVDVALVLTSFHQSPLPMALVLRMAGVPRIGAVSVDYPGSLLDVRHLVDEDCHEVLRYLSLGRAMGYLLPPGDDGRLGVAARGWATEAAPWAPSGAEDYVVVHPGASVSARAWDPDAHARVVERLSQRGWVVAVTGGRSEMGLTAKVAGARGADLGGRLSVGALARVMSGARAVVVGNTGPAHLAAALGTPVVSLYAPTVPASRWRPWRVPHVLLGIQDIPCAGCRARVCPVAGHPCISGVDAEDVVEAVTALAGPPCSGTGVSAGSVVP